jgi:hypothetical protein
MTAAATAMATPTPTPEGKASGAAAQQSRSPDKPSKRLRAIGPYAKEACAALTVALAMFGIVYYLLWAA